MIRKSGSFLEVMNKDSNTPVVQKPLHNSVYVPFTLVEFYLLNNTLLINYIIAYAEAILFTQ